MTIPSRRPLQLDRFAPLVALGIVLALSLWLALPAVSQGRPIGAQPRPTPRALEVVGHIGGAPQDVRIVGEHALVATGYALDAWDLSDPARPERVGRLLRPGARPGFGGDAGQRLRVYGDLVLILDRAAVRIIDIADPAAPVELGSYRFSPSRIHDAARLGDYLYVTAESPDGIAILDISDPGSPEYVARTFDGTYQHLVVSGDHLYAVGDLSEVSPPEHGLRVYDLSDPASPSPLARVPDVRAAYDLELDGDRLYATTNGGLRIYDISDPGAVERVGGYDTAEPVDAVSVAGDRAYITHRGVLEALDITSPLAPRAFGSLRIAERAFVAGEASVAAATGAAGLVVVTHAAQGGAFVDAADAADMRVIEAFNDEIPSASGLALSNGHAFVLSSRGLEAVDVTDPARPRRVGSPFDTDGGSHRRGIAVHENRAYLHVPSADARHELRVLDISDPAAPVGIGELPLGSGHADGLALRGDRAYLASQIYDPARSAPVESVHVVEVSEPATPTLLGLLEIQGVTPSGEGEPSLALVQDRLLLAVRDGLASVDVCGPEQPVVSAWLEGLPRPVTVNAVAAAGDQGYLAFRAHERGVDDSLALVDLTDPGAPALASLGAQAFAPQSLALSAAHLYTGAREGVQRLVTRTLSAPRVNRTQALPASVRALVHEDGYLYVADDDAGLFILYTGDDNVSEAAPPDPCPGPVEPPPPSPPPPSPTAAPPPATPAPTPTPSEPVACVCQRTLARVPAVVVADAVANPAGYYGWQLPLDPNKPVGPQNPRRACLALRSPSTPFHPLWNTVHWQVGCQ